MTNSSKRVGSADGKEKGRMTLILSSDLYQQIRTEAEEQHRTMSGQISLILEHYFDGRAETANQ